MRVISLLVVALVQIDALKTYENFKVYSVVSESLGDIESLRFWERNHLVDFWSLPGINKTTDILVDPQLQPAFEEFLSFENFNYEILIENVGKLVDPITAPRLFNLLKVFLTFFLPSYGCRPSSSI